MEEMLDPVQVKFVGFSNYAPRYHIIVVKNLMTSYKIAARKNDHIANRKNDYQLDILEKSPSES